MFRLRLNKCVKEDKDKLVTLLYQVLNTFTFRHFLLIFCCQGNALSFCLFLQFY